MKKFQIPFYGDLANFCRKNWNIATDYSILFSNFHISAKFHTQRKHGYVLASQGEQMLLLNIIMQKGIRAVQKCQGRKICNITGELLSNVYCHICKALTTIGDAKETTLESTIRASVVSNKLVAQFSSQNLIPIVKKKQAERTNQVNPSNGL